MKIDVEEGFEKAASDQPKTGSLLDFDGSVNQSQSQHKVRTLKAAFELFSQVPLL